MSAMNAVDAPGSALDILRDVYVTRRQREALDRALEDAARTAALETECASYAEQCRAHVDEMQIVTVQLRGMEAELAALKSRIAGGVEVE